MVGLLLDRFDSSIDNPPALKLEATEQMRIENEDLTTSYGSVTCNI
jgi:hypothetical protein